MNVDLSVSQIYTLANQCRRSRNKKEARLDKLLTTGIDPHDHRVVSGERAIKSICDLEDLLLESIGMTWEQLADDAELRAQESADKKAEREADKN